jgi:hypothetical protein
MAKLEDNLENLHKLDRRYKAYPEFPCPLRLEK